MTVQRDFENAEAERQTEQIERYAEKIPEDHDPGPIGTVKYQDFALRPQQGGRAAWEGTVRQTSAPGSLKMAVVGMRRSDRFVAHQMSMAPGSAICGISLISAGGDFLHTRKFVDAADLKLCLYTDRTVLK